MSEVIAIPPLGRVYKATLHRIVDADTFDVIPSRPVRLRPLGIDAAEIRSSDPAERAIAREQSTWTSEWWAARMPKLIRIDGRLEDAFGRELAWVIYEGDGSTPGSLFNDDFLARWGDAYTYPATIQVVETLARLEFPFLDTQAKKEEHRHEARKGYVVRDRNKPEKVLKVYDAEYIERLAHKPGQRGPL